MTPRPTTDDGRVLLPENCESADDWAAYSRQREDFYNHPILCHEGWQPDAEQLAVGDTLRRWREAVGMSTEELAHRINYLLPTAMRTDVELVRRWEAADFDPAADNAMWLVAWLLLTGHRADDLPRWNHECFFDLLWLRQLVEAVGPTPPLAYLRTAPSPTLEEEP